MSRNGAIALSWKEPMVIEPPAFAPAPLRLLAGLFELPPQAASQLAPIKPAAPTRRAPIA